ncbi:MAG TPA: HXXEE domain-containing protein [Firmicutes bacterium]|jgi:hypothetical protein|nr:HXXEE domain-containing protein [Bacillota bacterium]
MFEILFLMSFTLHNLEEAIWLPKWSKSAGKYHPQVTNNEFHFALFIITIFGYIVTSLFLSVGHFNEILKYIYLGFILMMCLNALFPHFLATITLKRYAPGTLTGLFLNLPIGLFVVVGIYGRDLEFFKLIVGGIIVTGVIWISLPPLFKLGKKLIDEY